MIQYLSKEIQKKSLKHAKKKRNVAEMARAPTCH